MIRVSRPLSGAPAAWLAKATAERQEAIKAFKRARKAFLKKQKGSKKKRIKFSFSFEYSVYRDGELKAALNAAYHNKCAYCESYVEGTGPIAVEHYRPKGEVIEGGKRIKPAYYWLASDWENLLPSCTDCNSPRGHATGPDGTRVTRGKGNHFPLEPGTKRANAPGRELNERPLLLHPERGDQPEVHLEFLVEQGRTGLVRPALLDGVPSPKGTTSIDVFALDRPVLTQVRRDLAAKLLSHLRNTKNAWSDHLAAPTEQKYVDRYQQNVQDLKSSYLDPSQPYSAMARRIVKAELPGVSL